MDAVAWPNSSRLLTTVASPEFRGAQRYDLLAIDVATGEAIWSLPTTIVSGSGLLSVSNGRALIYEPHPAVSGVHRLRLIDTADGSLLWEVSTTQPIDGARIEGELFVSTYRTIDTIADNRGHGTMILGPGRSWSIDTIDGIEQDMQLSDVGVVVLSGERSPVCIGRELLEPSAAENVAERVVSPRAN